MADISKIRLNDVDYNIKDAQIDVVTIRADYYYTFQADMAFGIVGCNGVVGTFVYANGELSASGFNTQLEIDIIDGNIEIDNESNRAAYAILYIME